MISPFNHPLGYSFNSLSILQKSKYFYERSDTMDNVIASVYQEKTINHYKLLNYKDVKIIIEYRKFNKKHEIDTFFHWYNCSFYMRCGNPHLIDFNSMIIMTDLVYGKMCSIECNKKNNKYLNLNKEGLIQLLMIMLDEFVEVMQEICDNDYDKFVEFDIGNMMINRYQEQIPGWKELVEHNQGISKHQFHFIDWSETLSEEEMKKIYFPDYKITRSQYGDISIFGKDMKGWIDY